VTSPQAIIDCHWLRSESWRCRRQNSWQIKVFNARVVSMPCAEIFSAQDAAYRDAVLPPSVRARVAVEALHADYWYKFVGLDGRVVGMTSFGESAPGDAC
jgi:transketolase